MPNPEYLTHYIVEALKKTHQGGIILSGWGNVGSNSEYKRFATSVCDQEVPDDWLFPQVPAVVHHGGSQQQRQQCYVQGHHQLPYPFLEYQPVWGSM
ncbi:MAG: hypothetical protein ACYTXI_37235 [Nostoc sp.]